MPRRRKSASITLPIGSILKVLGVGVFLVGLLILVSPSTYMELVGKLPMEIQERLLLDIFLSSTPRS